MKMPKEGRIEPAPEGEVERREELEKQRDRMEQEEESFARHIRVTAREINVQIREIEVEEFHSDDLENALSRPIINASEGIANPEADIRIQDLDRRLNECMRKINEADEKDKKWNTEKFIAASTAILAVGVALSDIIYQIISDKNKDKDDSNVPTDEETKKKIRELVKKWNEQTDKEYWENMAVYVEQNNDTCTLGDQILFMNYTIDLFPGISWIWDTASDKADMVDRLYDIYKKSGSKTSEMFRQVTSLKYNDMVMPRPVAADVLRYALSKIIVLD